LKLVQLEIEFTSNIRIAIEHRDHEGIYIGINKNLWTYEKHILLFERYISLPAELKALKEQQKKDASKDPMKAMKLRDEETVNPWIISQIDLSPQDFVLESEY
jgi:hypothetical protein